MRSLLVYLKGYKKETALAPLFKMLEASFELLVPLVMAQRIVDPKNLGFSVQSDEKKDYDKMKSGVMEEVKRLFKPEFINRIDEIMVFHPLHKENMKQIITLLARNLSKRCKEQMDISLTLTSSLKEFIIEEHADSKMGARPLKRAIQTVIEDALAEEILAGRIKPGDNVSVGVRDKKVVFHSKKLVD